MANMINRNLDGPPTQGRGRECRRRLRQLARQKRPDVAPVPQDMRQLVSALFDVPEPLLEHMAQLDEAQLGYVEDQVETAQALVETAPAGVEAVEYAKKVLAAMNTPVALNYTPRR